MAYIDLRKAYTLTSFASSLKALKSQLEFAQANIKALESKYISSFPDNPLFRTKKTFYDLKSHADKAQVLLEDLSFKSQNDFYKVNYELLKLAFSLCKGLIQFLEEEVVTYEEIQTLLESTQNQEQLLDLELFETYYFLEDRYPRKILPSSRISNKQGLVHASTKCLRC